MLSCPRPALLLGLLAVLPASASAAAMTGLSTSVGLAGALLALLASQRGSPSSAAAVLAIAALLLLVAVTAMHLRAQGRRFRPVFARRYLPQPILARAAATSQDERALLRAARRQFLELQAAWDAADLETLRRLTTDGMFEELAALLPERGGPVNRTDVLALEAHLIARDTVGSLELASIEFSGVVRESVQGDAQLLREVWMLTRSRPGEAWRLARQQALL
ncbi:MAG: TIM44-like domain-containing protein [Piscinibacter sp.]|uniref:TIM44-like domain-containing protein n=1 Tax=Piscinibacter sp. TaxID=1903157 RepID=UPI003D0F3BB5